MLTFRSRIFTRDVRILNKLLLEAKKVWKDAQEHQISIYASDSGNNWRHIASRPKRPLRSIVLDDGMKELLIDDAHDFLESKSWYADRGIPFRRGYLLVSVNLCFIGSFLLFSVWSSGIRKDFHNSQSRWRIGSQCVHHFAIAVRPR
jgi:hypothetical protein